MKIVIDMYGLGFKMHDLTEDQILMAVGRQPQYRERIYFWGAIPSCMCGKCPFNKRGEHCISDQVIPLYCRSGIRRRISGIWMRRLQPYFKKEVI